MAKIQISYDVITDITERMKICITNLTEKIKIHNVMKTVGGAKTPRSANSFFFQCNSEDAKKIKRNTWREMLFIDMFCHDVQHSSP